MKKLLKTLGILVLTTAHLIAAPSGKMKTPDFLKGDPIPEGATHDWNLGATGARGWIFSSKMVTSEARQIYITKVDARSPAAKVLKVGDVILGVSGKPFSYDPRTEFGKALTIAESNAGKGNLSLICWRQGKQKQLVVKLPVLGTYSATAPYDCPKSSRILKQGCAALAKRMKEDNYGKQSPVTRSLNALALLASGESKYRTLVKKEAQWASNYSADGMASWYYGYVIMLLSEYHMATGDKSVMPGLKRLTLEASNGQSRVGSWGHKFAGDDGRLLGYGMMNAPGVPLTTSLVLARKAGVKAPEVDLAIERSLNLLRFYAGKGSIPYGDHHPWIQNHDDNGKNGMTAVLFSLLGETKTAEYFSRMSLACHGNERDTGHTGNFWNMTWAIPGVVQSGPHATGAWMDEFGSWYYDLVRRWDGNLPHQGPPQMRKDSTGNWDATGAYLLAYAMPLKKIFLTGKNPSSVPQLSAKQAKSIIIDGRGWSNNKRNKAYDQLKSNYLFERLASWSPIVRERAAMALARRKGIESPVPNLIKMLDSPSLEARDGACRALIQLRGKAAPAVAALRKNLKHEDLWLRVKSAEALASIGNAAMVALPELLTMVIQGPSDKDPRAMEQRYLSFAIFGKMLNRSIDGVDRDQLFKAVRAGLQNEDGRARGSYASIYDKLSYKELEPLMPDIYRAIVEPAPSGIMFADQIQTAGLKLFAKHGISEGVELTAAYAKNMKQHASEKRIIVVMELMKSYGAHGQRAIPMLEDAIDYFDNKEKSFPKRLGQFKSKTVRDAIKEIKESTERPKLRSIKSAL
jgi:hypothetical protein